MSAVNSIPVLQQALWQTSGNAIWTKRMMLFVAGIAALWISARVQIATVPVPVTLQMLVIMVIGAAYGSRLGLATVLGYLALGAAGYPVFAGTPEKGIGWLYMLGPTGGYLLGFALAAFVIGRLAERGWDRHFGTMALAMAIGLVCVYAPGVVWLSSGFGLFFAAPFDGAFTGHGWANWYAYGVKTFIWVDALKLVVAVMLFPVIWRWIGNAR